MNYKESINMISADIRDAECFLLNYPITDKLSLFCSPGESMEFVPGNGIFFHFKDEDGTFINKKLIETPLCTRISAHAYLASFMKFCLEETGDNFDSHDILNISKQIKEIMGVWK